MQTLYLSYIFPASVMLAGIKVVMYFSIIVGGVCLCRAQWVWNTNQVFYYIKVIAVGYDSAGHTVCNLLAT